MSFSSEVKSEVRNKNFTSKKHHSKINGDISGRLAESKERIIASFLRSGSISDPERFYHLEIVTGSEEEALDLKAAIEDFGIEPGVMHRKERYVVYVKDSESIADMLVVLGAVNAVLDFENVRVLKSMKEQVQRSVNCETANISKTVSAAVRQLEDIRLIKEEGDYARLPQELKIAAELRINNPEASLKELAGLLPDVGKSGINHRLRKLSSIAEELRSGKGGAS